MARCLLILIATAAIAPAQSTKAELFGTLRDPAGLPVADAAVDLTNTDTQAMFAMRSDALGGFRFSGLAAGNYEIAVAKDGFNVLRRGGIMLVVGDKANLDLALSVGNVNESIVVSPAPLLQAASGTASFVVDQKRVANLPLDGRNFVPLIALSPGVNLPPGQFLPRVNGSRPRTSEYIYDGVSVLQPEPGQVAYFPIVDAIQEFRVETNSPSAEYGRSNGGVIMVNQKAGTNELHGTLFEFFRNEALNARNLFATTGDKPRFRRNQYGFVLGGPIRKTSQKSKTFFFIDWQGTRLQQGVVRVSTVPTAAQKSGQFTQAIFDPETQAPFAGNRIPATAFDAVALRLLDRYPAPTQNGAANNYRRVGNDTTAQDQFDVRVDRHLGAQHKVFARYAYLRDDSIPATPLPDGSGTFTATYIGHTLTRADSVAAEDAWVISPHAVNQVRFGFSRRGFDRTALDIPVYDIAGFQRLGPPASGNATFTTSVTQFIDNFTWNRGRHSVKLGADIRLQRLDALQPPHPNGNFQFTSVFTGHAFASFLLGQVTSYSIDLQEVVLKPRATIAEFFVQDDWRVTPRLTLNIGTRYTLNMPSTVAGDRGAVFNLDTQQLDYLGRDGFPRSARDLEKRNFGPRLGLAYKITDTLVARAAYSLTWIEQTGITTPFTTPLFPFIQTLTQQTRDNIAPAFVLAQGPSVTPRPPDPDAGLGQGVFGVQRDTGSGYAQQWNFSLQKTLGENWSFELGYLGSKLTRLGVPDINLNQVRVEDLVTYAAHNGAPPQISNTCKGAAAPCALQPGVTLARPYPQFQTVTLYRNNVGHSTYHSFQSRVEKRFSQGLTFTLAYTFSRLIDDAGQVFDSAVLTGPVANYQVADSYNRKLEKDVSTGNVPHIVSFGGVYELWGGWQIGGLLRLQSGSPLAVTQATNFNAFAGFGIQRPNRLADPTLPGEQRTTGRWFDTAAFTQAGQYTIGNSSRNPVVGPGYRAADVMVGKTFALGERLHAEVRVEAFNVTNTPHLGNPNTSFGNPAFGSITTALDPRVYECVLKLHF